MKFYNDFDIEMAARRHQENPILSRAARVLAEYRDIVNQNSDGWGTWTAGTKVAGSLVDLLEKHEASETDVRKAVTRVKSFCTRRGLPQPASA